MPESTTPQEVLADWKTILGEPVELGGEYAGRDLWPVTAADGGRYFLKRLGPWRNLPVADEARVLRHLARQGIPVAEFEFTDRATLWAGSVAEAFVLMPHLVSDVLRVDELAALGETLGGALAELHLALGLYPHGVNSYVEDIAGSLAGDLTLPPDVTSGLDHHRQSTIALLANLPTQLVHGDMTPGNVLLRRPGTVAGFIDFDHLPVAPRVWDIARYLSRRIRLRWREDVPLTEVARLDPVSGLVAGYHRRSPLTATELAATPALVLAGNLIEASYFQEIANGTLQRRRLPDHDLELADIVEAGRWHLAHTDEVSRAVLAGIA